MTPPNTNTTEETNMNEPTNETSIIEALDDETESSGQELAPVRQSPPAEIVKLGPAAEAISAEDLGIPRMMVGQPSSVAVQDGRVPAGAIYIGANAEDPEVRVMYKPGGRGGVDVLPLAFQKGWAFRDEGDVFRVVPDGSEGVPWEAVPAHTWLFCCPAFDSSLPVSYLFKVSALPTSQKIALAVKQAAPAPSWTLAFRLTTVPRANSKGRWYVPQVVSVPKPKPEHVEAATQLATELGIDGAA